MISCNWLSKGVGLGGQKTPAFRKPMLSLAFTFLCSGLRGVSGNFGPQAIEFAGLIFCLHKIVVQFFSGYPQNSFDRALDNDRIIDIVTTVADKFLACRI